MGKPMALGGRSGMTKNGTGGALDPRVVLAKTVLSLTASGATGVANVHVLVTVGCLN